MHAQSEPGVSAGEQDLTRLLGVECAALAEHVDPAGERQARGEHLPADEVDVVVGAMLVLGRHDMGAEEGDVVGQRGRQLAQPLLAVDVERIAGLDLDVRDPGPQRLPATGAGQREQLHRVRGAGGGHGRADPAGRVGGAGHPGGELIGAVTREHEVGVAVDEPGDDAQPVGVDAGVGQRPGRLHGDDPVALEHERGVAADPERPVAELGVVRDEQADVVDHQ